MELNFRPDRFPSITCLAPSPYGQGKLLPVFDQLVQRTCLGPQAQIRYGDGTSNCLRRSIRPCVYSKMIALSLVEGEAAVETWTFAPGYSRSSARSNPVRKT